MCDVAVPWGPIATVARGNHKAITGKRIYLTVASQSLPGRFYGLHGAALGGRPVEKQQPTCPRDTLAVS